MDQAIEILAEKGSAKLIGNTGFSLVNTLNTGISLVNTLDTGISLVNTLDTGLSLDRIRAPASLGRDAAPRRHLRGRQHPGGEEQGREQ